MRLSFHSQLDAVLSSKGTRVYLMENFEQLNWSATRHHVLYLPTTRKSESKQIPLPFDNVCPIITLITKELSKNLICEDLLQGEQLFLRTDGLISILFFRSRLDKAGFFFRRFSGNTGKWSFRFLEFLPKFGLEFWGNPWVLRNFSDF